MKVEADLLAGFCSTASEEVNFARSLSVELRGARASGFRIVIQPDRHARPKLGPRIQDSLMDLNDQERYAAAALFTLALHHSQADCCNLARLTQCNFSTS